jgi:hypothetical protein
MNRYRSSGHVNDAPTCGFVTAQFENHVDNTVHLLGILPRLPGVNRNQKGLRAHRQKSIRAQRARPNAGIRSNSPS